MEKSFQITVLSNFTFGYLHVFWNCERKVLLHFALPDCMNMSKKGIDQGFPLSAVRKRHRAFDNRTYSNDSQAIAYTKRPAFDHSEAKRLKRPYFSSGRRRAVRNRNGPLGSGCREGCGVCGT